MFSKIMNLLWPILCTIGQIFISANGPILNKKASHLVTLEGEQRQFVPISIVTRFSEISAQAIFEDLFS